MSDHLNGLAESNRQAIMEKKRADMLSEFESQKRQIELDNKVKIGADKFVTEVETIENHLKRSTVGLYKLEDFKRIKNELERNSKSGLISKKSSKNKKKKKSVGNTLSFSFEDEEEGGDSQVTKIKIILEETGKVKKFGKDPTVDTSFLPDKEREEEEIRLKEQFKTEWLQRQEELKEEMITVTYSYWDGSGHRYQVECKKGDSIAKFLEKCRLQVHELRGVHTDNMLFVKEDIIIPHHYTFYDFIINKARGKCGPLFNFDVQEDVRLVFDASIETQETHAGKVMEKSWYEKNKHIFPASRWEVFDPEKNYGKYSSRDGKNKRA
ncbi:FAM50A protein [Neoconidiobolus thromboides FSU 785]|nr:FAM50A protein [Neoconidiobolus thromboides FSU 785]